MAVARKGGYLEDIQYLRKHSTVSFPHGGALYSAVLDEPYRLSDGRQAKAIHFHENYTRFETTAEGSHYLSSLSEGERKLFVAAARRDVEAQFARREDTLRRTGFIHELYPLSKDTGEAVTGRYAREFAGPVKWSRGIDIEFEGYPWFRGVRFMDFKDSTNAYLLDRRGEAVPFESLPYEDFVRITDQAKAYAERFGDRRTEESAYRAKAVGEFFTKCLPSVREYAAGFLNRRRDALSGEDRAELGRYFRALDRGGNENLLFGRLSDGAKALCYDELQSLLGHRITIEFPVFGPGLLTPEESLLVGLQGDVSLKLGTADENLVRWPRGEADFSVSLNAVHRKYWEDVAREAVTSDPFFEDAAPLKDFCLDVVPFVSMDLYLDPGKTSPRVRGVSFADRTGQGYSYRAPEGAEDSCVRVSGTKVAPDLRSYGPETVIALAERRESLREGKAVVDALAAAPDLFAALRCSPSEARVLARDYVAARAASPVREDLSVPAVATALRKRYGEADSSSYGALSRLLHEVSAAGGRTGMSGERLAAIGRACAPALEALRRSGCARTAVFARAARWRNALEGGVKM